MADEATRKGKVLREFRDAGDEKLFEEGKSYDFGEGAFGNYAAAELVEPDETPAPAAKPLPAPTPPRADA